MCRYEHVDRTVYPYSAVAKLPFFSTAFDFPRFLRQGRLPGFGPASNYCLLSAPINRSGLALVAGLPWRIGREPHLRCIRLTVRRGMCSSLHPSQIQIRGLAENIHALGLTRYLRPSEDPGFHEAGEHKAPPPPSLTRTQAEILSLFPSDSRHVPSSHVILSYFRVTPPTTTLCPHVLADKYGPGVDKETAVPRVELRTGEFPRRRVALRPRRSGLCAVGRPRVHPSWDALYGTSPSSSHFAFSACCPVD
ncbi:hypothetical protein VTK73DRAFT_8743 [Phialemonium thermophilum]|uniref:Uncharacterized protein n=1 Tax=Phialemonium thermophilum TaxID=223376 RepID=A0ABR3W774_9PEZI